MKRIIHEKIIEMKLQQGDYVEGLTKEQFDELMELQPVPYGKLLYSSNSLSLMGFGVDGKFPFIGMKNSTSTTLLSFTEFKQRAINTFER